MTKSQAPEKPAKNATTKQSRRPPAKRGRKPGLTAAEKTERDCNLIRRRLAGLPWSEVAREFDLSQSQAREIFAAWRDTHDPLPEVPEDPINFLVESLCRLALIGESYGRIANDERVDLGHRLAAMKAQMRVIREEFDMRYITGLLPRRGEMRTVLEVQEIGRRVTAWLDKHDVPEEMRREFVAIVQDASRPRQLEHPGSTRGSSAADSIEEGEVAES